MLQGDSRTARSDEAEDEQTGTESKGRWPDFLIIGAMKSGTTTLWASLARHPRIFLCVPKEPQFFSRDHVYARGADWYRSLFAPAGLEQICGEASACYTRWPHFGDVAGRIEQHVPRAKLVYIMRHPVERAYSHYAHLMQERALYGGGSMRSFEEALDEIPEIVDTSLYARQIEQYLTHFPRAALHCLALDDLRRDPDGTLGALHAYLGVDPRPLDESESDTQKNRFGDRLARVTTRRRLDRLRRIPGAAGALRLVPAGLRRQLRALASRPALTRLLARRSIEATQEQLTPLSLETRRRLLERLAGPTRRLEELLGRPLPAAWFE